MGENSTMAGDAHTIHSDDSITMSAVGVTAIEDMLEEILAVEFHVRTTLSHCFKDLFQGFYFTFMRTKDSFLGALALEL